MMIYDDFGMYYELFHMFRSTLGIFQCLTGFFWLGLGCVWAGPKPKNALKTNKNILNMLNTIICASIMSIHGNIFLKKSRTKFNLWAIKFLCGPLELQN